MTSGPAVVLAVLALGDLPMSHATCFSFGPLSFAYGTVVVAGDPEVLFVPVTVWKTGKVEFGRLRNFPEGKVDRSRAPGEYSFRLLDADRRVLHEETFPIEFKAISDSGLVELDQQSVAMRLPYPSGTAHFQFLKGDVVLAEFNPQALTLRNGVEDIADRGFAERPKERRKALLQKVAAFEKMLTQKNNRGALEKLRNDLRPHVEQWIVEYQEQDPMEFTKEELLTLIDRIIARLESQP